MPELQDQVDAFFNGEPFAVVGASTNRDKYGNRVLRLYQQKSLDVHPVNPRAERVEGLKAYPDLSSLPRTPHAISIITPPQVTEQVIEEAAELGIRHVWMQPGAESDEAVRQAESHGMNVIAGGPCILVVGGYTERHE